MYFLPPRSGSLLRLAVALAVGALGTTPASADPLPLNVVGAPPNMIKVSTSGPLAFTLGNGGGGFQGRVWDGQIQSGPSHTTTMWCIDSQLLFSNGNSGLANITLLSSLPTAEARYGTIDQPAPGTPGWTNDLGAGFNDAATRFRMAAWLVQQYSGFPGGPSANTDANRKIQEAIWAVIHNNTAAAAGVNKIANATVANWVAQAKASYQSVSASGWAIVTWVVNADGTFKLDKSRQTFLVQVVPEPGFYLALGLALGLLFLAQRRRQLGSTSAS